MIPSQDWTACLLTLSWKLPRKGCFIRTDLTGARGSAILRALIHTSLSPKDTSPTGLSLGWLTLFLYVSETVLFCIDQESLGLSLQPTLNPRWKQSSCFSLQTLGLQVLSSHWLTFSSLKLIFQDSLRGQLCFCWLELWIDCNVFCFWFLFLFCFLRRRTIV